MPATKRSQRLVQPKYGASHRAEPGGRGPRLAIILLACAALGFMAFSPPGVAAMAAAFRFLEFYSGVFSLVALSLTMMGGLAATDRMVLQVRHRIVLQSAHRSVATAAVVFLGVHILTKVAEGHASVADVVVPFLAAHRTFYVGLGTIASYLLVGVLVTGVVRGRFAGSKRVWLWRTLHSLAYACWPIALLHGLNAGRAAKPWVTLSYVLCLIAVGLALMVRLWAVWTRQLRTPRTRVALGEQATSIAAGSMPAAKMPAATMPTVEDAVVLPVDATWPASSTAESLSRAPSPTGPRRPKRSPNAANSAARAPGASKPAPTRPEPAKSAGPTPAKPAAAGSEPARPVGRWANTGTDTITDEEFWAYLRKELAK